MSCAPLVSMSTVKPSSHSRFINGSEFGWSNGSPPVSSTNGSRSAELRFGALRESARAESEFGAPAA